MMSGSHSTRTDLTRSCGISGKLQHELNTHSSFLSHLYFQTSAHKRVKDFKNDKDKYFTHRITPSPPTPTDAEMEQNPMVLDPLPPSCPLPSFCLWETLAKRMFNQRNEKCRNKWKQSKETK